MEKGGHQVDLLGAVDVGGTTRNAGGYVWAWNINKPTCNLRVSSVVGRGRLGVPEACWPRWGSDVELNSELDGLDEVAQCHRIAR